MSAPPVRIEVVPRTEAGTPDVPLFLGAVGLFFASVLISGLMALVLHRAARRMSPARRILVAGLLPLLLTIALIVSLATYNSTLDQAFASLLSMKARGYGLFALILVTGVLTAWQETRRLMWRDKVRADVFD